MLKSYFRITWRNLLKDRQFTALNLVGLSVGLACTLLIGLWVADERSRRDRVPRILVLYQRYPDNG